MASGDIVIYTADPLLYGKLIVLGAHKDGRLECEAIHREPDGTYARELFNPQELELASEWERRTLTA